MNYISAETFLSLDEEIQSVFIEFIMKNGACLVKITMNFLKILDVTDMDFLTEKMMYHFCKCISLFLLLKKNQDQASTLVLKGIIDTC